MKQGIDLDYDCAYKGLTKWKKESKETEKMSYEQIAGFLESFADSNEDSLVDMRTNEEEQVTHVFCCPGFMNELLKAVKPVLQMDACHRKGIWGGTLYYITVLSASQDIYPVAFGLTSDNESE